MRLFPTSTRVDECFSVGMEWWYCGDAGKVVSSKSADLRTFEKVLPIRTEQVKKAEPRM